MGRPPTPPATRGERDQGYGRTSRTYAIPGTDRVYDSVTSILGVIGKPALIAWAANKERELVLEAAANLYEDLPAIDKKMARPSYLATLQQRLGKEKAHQRELAKAGDIGTQVHGLIEWNLRQARGEKVGPEPRIGDKATWAFMAFEDWRKTVDLKPLAIEQVVWSEEHEYAGTLDLYAEATLQGFGRVRIVADWKTGKAIYDEALLQIAAYEHALNEMGHSMQPVLGCILRLPKLETDPDFEVRIVSAQELRDHLRAFLHVKAVWDWQQAMKRGAPMRNTDAAPAPPGGAGLPTAAPSLLPEIEERTLALRVIHQARKTLGDEVVQRILANQSVVLADIQRVDVAVLAAVLEEIEAAAKKAKA